MTPPDSPRLWTTLGLAGSALALGLAAPQAGAVTPDLVPSTQTTAAPVLVQAEGGEGGESGEAGEAGVALIADPVLEVLTALTLIEGHLRAGLALHHEAAHDLALTHMKHPGDELYSDLAEELDALGLQGFSEELTALADVVTDGGDGAPAAFDAVLARLDALRAELGATPSDTLFSAMEVLRTAAAEYGVGVAEDGTILDAHEYQDAWGFLQAVRRQVDTLDDIPARAEALAALDDASAAFDGVNPQTVTNEGALLHVAAARVELAALGLD